MVRRLETMSIGEGQTLNFISQCSPKERAKVSEHNKYRHKKINETDEEYSLISKRTRRKNYRTGSR